MGSREANAEFSVVSERERRILAQLDDYCRVLRATVSRLCPRSLGSHREDIEQEARVRLWRALLRESEIANPSSYLYKVVTSVTIDAIRRVRARREVPLPDTASPQEGELPPPAARSTSPEEKLSHRELLQRLRRGLETLAVDRRRAVGLHLQGFTTAEIAALLGWTDARSRNLVHRGLKDLRRYLLAEPTGQSDTRVRADSR